MANVFEGGGFHADLTAVTSATQALALANPEGRDLYVRRVILVVGTASSGAATLDIGIAANGTTSADNLLDGITTTPAGVTDNLTAPGTNGKAGRKWGATEYLTATASATLAGLVGELIIDYVPL